MFRRGLSRHVPLLIALVLVLLLAVLATLQHRWIGQVSQMQRHRMRADLTASGSRFAEDFDREMSRAWAYFHPAPGDSEDWRERAVRQWESWAAGAPHPDLVHEVFYVRRDERGGGDAEVLRPGAHRFEPAPWPADLEPLRRRFEQVSERGPREPVVADVPALVLTRFSMGPPGLGDPERREPPPGPRESLILRLDPQVITGEILPDLTRRHFGDDQNREYSVLVVAADDPGRVIYQSDPGVRRRDGDASLPIFGVRPFEGLRGLFSEPGMEGPPDRPDRRFGGPGPGPRPGGPRGGGFGSRPGERHGAWRLVLLHRDGTLEEAVTRLRHKNLAVSAGILALLAVAAGLMMITAQRAQKVARQQIELVAGVTHELNTPITAIRSAGQNLAAGVVADPAQVKRYGAMIEGEGQRLSRMVAQMLELAGLQSGQATYTLQPTVVQDVLDGAIADCRWLLEEKQARIEKDIDPALPPVLGDAGALRRALRNLVENAAKYGGRSPWIGVRARATGREVEVTVEDRGPGIRREDLPHLFQPFFRGREVKTGGIPGSGLGLSVVRRIAEAHRGRVSVAAGGPGGGSAFTLHLPIAPEEAS